MEHILQGNKISLGVCYYPEHWDKSLWRDDLQRMKKRGILTVRIAEFAWNKFESAEGIFNFDFFDSFMDTAEKEDVSVIFGTPTATPPAWLTYKYPEVLNARMDGVLYRHGSRRHYNYNSPVYRRLSARIVEQLGSHYGKHPGIIGWQIDNEINCETDEFYSGSDTAAFRAFLMEKYPSLESLNEAWGTIVWNQTYTSWEEIFVPRPTLNNSVNPHQVMDYIRFVSHSARSFVRLQSEILQKHIKPGDFITTNGMFSNLDNHRMTKESLDYYFYDSYPNFSYCLGADPLHSTDLNDRRVGRALSEVRSVSPRFGIMEQQSGPNGWNTRMEAASPRPGQMTLWTMQSIAHGADYVSYFRWRTAVAGTEIYWHGILDYSNRDNRRLAEIEDINKKVESISPAAGTVYRAVFAVLKDYDNIWDARLDVWHRRVEEASGAGIFQVSQLCHAPMDYLYLGDSEDPASLPSPEKLRQYPVLFYPHPVIMTRERAALLESYAAGGGTLVLGCRSAYKDPRGQCPMVKLPGLLRELSGTDVVDFSFVAPDDERIRVKWEDDEFEAAVFNDILEPLGDAEILAAYRDGWYAGKAALIVKNHGKGRIFYFGGAFGRDAAAVFIKKLGLAEAFRDTITLPPSCEIALREGKGNKFYFVLNYLNEAAEITLHKTLIDSYTGQKTGGTVKLPPYGTAVYKEICHG